MKKILLLLVFSLPLFVSGQNWCPSGATWYYDFKNFGVDGYYKIEYKGDTTINSILCKKLVKTWYWQVIFSSTPDTTLLGTEYTYADNNKVYIFKHNQFYTLYDFSAQIGNTWTVPGIRQYNGCDSVGTIKVDSIGTIMINNQSLRYICVSPADTAQKWGWRAKIVEKIGPIRSYIGYNSSYLFPQKNDNCGLMMHEAIEGGNFRCYSDHSIFSYTSNIATACDFITSVNSTHSNATQLKVFPNPSNGSFNVDIDPTMHIKEIRLSDLLGNIILQQQTNNQTRIKIDAIKSGVYILTAIDQDNKTFNKTIISSP